MNGMPRSGSTALFNLLFQYASRTVEVVSQGFFSEDDLLMRSRSLEKWALDDTVTIIKTHFKLPEKIYQLRKSSEVFEFYSYRDVLEIALSMKRVWGFDNEKVIDSLDLHTSISTEYRAKKDDIKLISFAYIVSSPELVLKDMVSYLGWKIDEELVSLSVSKCLEFRDKKPLYRDKYFSMWNSMVKSLNKRLQIGKFLKRILPYKGVILLRDKVIITDKETMFHPGHVGKNINSLKTDEIVPGDFEELISSRYLEWRTKFGYLKN